MAKEKETLTSDEKFELLRQALTEQRTGITPESLRDILTQNSQAVQKALKPENTTHPNISAFRPKGGADPVLPYACLYNGFPVHKAVETHTDRELELLLQVEPGEYPSVIRNDHTPMQVSVRAERDANGKIEKLEIQFPVTREDKPKIPPMQVVLYQLVHATTSANPMHLYVAAVQDRLNWLMEAVPA